MTRTDRAVEEIGRMASDVGVRAWVHARRLGPDGEALGHDGNEQVPMASLYKLPLAGCWSDLVHCGVLDPAARVLLQPRHRTAGPTGVSALLDDVELSARDMVRLMLSVSDNASADHVLGIVGVDRLSDWLAHHRVDDTVVRRGTAESWKAVVAETGGGSPLEAPARLADPDVDIQTSEYDTALASVTTAADMVETLAVLWSVSEHEMVRQSLRLQAWRHRVGSGFPHDDVIVYGKTGTLGRLRHEVAVVEFPGEFPVAVAVLTKSARPEMHQPRVDAAIGSIARSAVTALRRPRV